MSRLVVEGEGFAAQLAAQLGTARGPRGEPTLDEFTASDLVSARRYLAEAFDVLRLVEGGYRMLTVVDPITHVPYFHRLPSRPSQPGRRRDVTDRYWLVGDR